MKIAVCVKHVPDMQSERRLEDGTLVRGEDDVLNELDENAIEEAVSLTEDHGGQVVAFTMGPEDAEEAVARALQMGADRGVHICDDRLAGSDVFATAQVLAAAIQANQQDGPFDLVVTGMASLDGMTSMLPAALATELNLPFVGLISEVTVEDRAVFGKRVADGFEDVLRAPLPAVISVTDQVNDPRYPNFKQMAAARKKPVDTMALEELEQALQDVGCEIPVWHVGSQSSGANVLAARSADEREAGTVVTDTGEGGRKLAAYLKEALQ